MWSIRNGKALLRRHREARLAYFACLPSFLSATLCIGTTVVALAVIDRAFIGQNPFLYAYVSGPEGLLQAIQSDGWATPSAWFHFGWGWHADGGFIYSYILIAFMTAILYTALELAMTTFGRARVSAAALHTIQGASRPAAVHQWLLRAGLRFGTLISAALYTVFFLHILVPYAISQSRFGIATIDEWLHVGYILLAGLLLSCGLHVLVVLLRIFCLRPRIFGGIDVLLMSESKN